MKRAFAIWRYCLRSCDFGVAASCLDSLNVACVFACVSCCYGAFDGSFPFWKGSEINVLLCEDEFGYRFLRIVDEDDNQPRDQQCRNDNGCEDSAFGHGLDKVLRFTCSTQPTYLSWDYIHI